MFQHNVRADRYSVLHRQSSDDHPQNPEIVLGAPVTNNTGNSTETIVFISFEKQTCYLS